jgi:hypothetical protein
LAAHHSGKPAILWPLGHRHLQSALTLRSPEEGEAFPAPDPTALLPYYREQANGETDGQEIQPLFTKCLFCHHEGALPGDRGAAKELCGPYFNVDALPEELFQFLSTPSLFGKIRLYANIQTPCTDTDNPKPFKVCLIRPHDTVLGQSRDTVEMKARYAMKLFGASFEDARDDERGSDENHAGFTGNRSDILSNFYLKTVWNHYIQKRLPDGTRVQSMAYSPDNCRVNGTKEDKNWVFWSVVLGRCLDAQGHWETQNTAIVTLHISLSMDDGEHLQWDDDMVEAKRNFDHGCSSHFDLADAFYRKFQELHPGMTDEANPLTVFRQLLNPAGI